MAIAALAAGQHGVVSRGQLLDAGITDDDDREARGDAASSCALHRGVYAVGHAHLRPNGYRLAAVLAVGPGAVLSHRDAAALHGLRDGGGTRIDVSTPAERRSTQTDPRPRPAAPRRRATSRRVEGIPVTTVARTLVDLGEVARAPGAAPRCCSEAERQRTLDVKGIEEALGRLRGRRGPSVAKLRAALESSAATAPHSPAHAWRTASSPSSMPTTSPAPRRTRTWRATRRTPSGISQRLVVELDGWDAHKTRRAFQHDRTKANALDGTPAGRVLRFTHDDLVRRPRDDGGRVAAQLSRAA